MESSFRRIEVPKDLEALSEQELLDLKVEVDARVREVRNELKQAGRRFASGGPPANLEWMRRAEAFVGINGKTSQKILSVLHQKKEARKEISRKEFRERHERTSKVNGEWLQSFQRVAKEKLPPGVYFELVAEAHARTQHNSPNNESVEEGT